MHKESSPLAWRLSIERYKLFRSIADIKGKVESFTIMNVAPKGFDKNTPYVIALISLDSGKKIISQIVESDEISIGMEVEPCIRRIYVDGDDGLVHYGTKFRVIK
ncbi:OB-fold domain-containing protein [Candidatus Woesearchaeota archaeon]|nr:OB-fold domain-containing protein [Candidatus Woesearchaeota archaeon]